MGRQKKQQNNEQTSNQTGSTKKAKGLVLSFRRRLEVAPALFYSCSWDTKEDTTLHIPVQLSEQTIRGVIRSDNLNTKNDVVPDSNIQTSDTAFLHSEHDTLLVQFFGEILPLTDEPTNCSYTQLIQRFQTIYKKTNKEIYKEIARRQVLNLVNGRFLWRNRTKAEDVETIIRLKNDGEFIEFKFKSLLFPLIIMDIEQLSNYLQQEKNVSPSEVASIVNDIDKIAEAFSSVLQGQKPLQIFEVESYCKLYKGAEVYPSEEFVDKETASNIVSKTKYLYSVPKMYKGKEIKIAAFHTQKITNAIHTIDTWYDPENINGLDLEDFVVPINVNPYGIVTQMGIVARPKSANIRKGDNFYALVKKYLFDEKLTAVLDVKTEEEDPYVTSPDKEKLFVIANLCVGGVFSLELNKDNPNNTDKTTNNTEE
jgi:CRISPR-associated protein Csy3